MARKYSIPAISGAFLLFTLSIGEALAYDPPAREGQWNFTVQTRYIDGQSIDGKKGSTADVNDTLGWGIGVGYNLTDNLELGMDISWANANYKGTYVTDTGSPGSLNGTMSTSSLALNASYYFTQGAVSPFIMGGIGSTFIDSNIPNGPPTTGCWYDPWWGYICNTYQSTYSTNNFSYNLGLGLRWDLAPGFYMRGIIGEMWIDADGGTADMTNYRVDFGFTFR